VLLWTPKPRELQQEKEDPVAGGQFSDRVQALYAHGSGFKLSPHSTKKKKENEKEKRRYRKDLTPKVDIDSPADRIVYSL
jgi:hypothetical protein